jgi:26S proteasome regulatory subunit N9
MAVQDFVSKPESGPFQVEFYNHFISDWEAKMSQTKLVALGVSAARQIPGTIHSHSWKGHHSLL